MEQTDGRLKMVAEAELEDDIGRLNHPVEEIREQIISSISRGLPELEPHPDQPDKVLVFIGGGPSLNDSIDDIRKLAKEGHPIVAMNGSNIWLDDHNIRYHAHVVLDSRPFNARFVEKPKDHVKYFICSQCHPTVFDALEGHDVMLWHGGTAKFALDEINERSDKDKYTVVKTGRTVILAALYLFRKLGFYKFEIFGWDSCLMENDLKHHAYKQDENNLVNTVGFTINGRPFVAHPWMIGQIQDFLKFTQYLGDKFLLNVHGDGAIAHCIKTIGDTGKLEFGVPDEDELIIAEIA